MNFFKILPILLSIIFMSGCGSTNHAKNSIPEKTLYGNWNCKMNLETEKIKISLDYDINYIRDGKSNGLGIMKFKTPSLPEIEYSLATSGNWELKDGYLIESSSETKLVNLSHPEFDEVLNLERLFPQNVSLSAEVLILNDSLLKVKSEIDGTVISCNRSPSKG